MSLTLSSSQASQRNHKEEVTWRKARKGASLEHRAWPRSLLAGKRRRPALLGVMRTLPSASKNCSLRVALATRAAGGGPSTSITHCICSASFSPATAQHQHPSRSAKFATLPVLVLSWSTWLFTAPACSLTTRLGGNPILPLRDASSAAVEGQSMSQNMPGHAQREPASDCS